jgi:TetR/AcrR family transcriptional regulator
MPKATFQHLPAAKRERFTSAALDEFALHDYRTASLSRIVRTAGIAKGSVYQYFGGKQDLYLYLVTLAAERKFGFIDGALPADEDDFFERFRLTVFHGARFDFTHPRLASLLYNATYEPSGPETRAVSTQLRAASYRYLRGLVDAGIRAGDLRADLDVDFAVFALYQLTISLRDYLSERFSFSFVDAVRRGGGSPVPDDDLMAVLGAFVDLLHRGLAAGGRHPDRSR